MLTKYKSNVKEFHCKCQITNLSHKKTKQTKRPVCPAKTNQPGHPHRSFCWFLLSWIGSNVPQLISLCIYTGHFVGSTTAFRLEHVLFYQLYAKITTCFNQEKFDTALRLYADVEMFGGNWHEDDVKTSKLMSKCHTDVMYGSRQM